MALSWIDATASLAWTRGALTEPVYLETVHGMAAAPLPEPLKPGPNRPTFRRVTLDVDTARVAAWLIEDLFVMHCGVPRDPAAWQTPANEET